MGGGSWFLHGWQVAAAVGWLVWATRTASHAPGGQASPESVVSGLRSPGAEGEDASLLVAPALGSPRVLSATAFSQTCVYGVGKSIAPLDGRHFEGSVALFHRPHTYHKHAQPIPPPATYCTLCNLYPPMNAYFLRVHASFTVFPQSSVSLGHL